MSTFVNSYFFMFGKKKYLFKNPLSFNPFTPPTPNFGRN